MQKLELIAVVVDAQTPEGSPLFSRSRNGVFNILIRSILAPRNLFSWLVAVLVVVIAAPTAAAC